VERAPSQWTSAKRANINTRLNGQYRSSLLFSMALRVSSVNDQALLRLDCSRFYLLFRWIAVLIQAFQTSLISSTAIYILMYS
jgi:hypothetical protein